MQLHYINDHQFLQKYLVPNHRHFRFRSSASALTILYLALPAFINQDFANSSLAIFPRIVSSKSNLRRPLIPVHKYCLRCPTETFTLNLTHLRRRRSVLEDARYVSAATKTRRRLFAVTDDSRLRPRSRRTAKTQAVFPAGVARRFSLIAGPSTLDAVRASLMLLYLDTSPFIYQRRPVDKLLPAVARRDVGRSDSRNSPEISL